MKEPPPWITRCVRIFHPEETLVQPHKRSVQFGSTQLERHNSDLQPAHHVVYDTHCQKLSDKLGMPIQSTFYRPSGPSFKFHQSANVLSSGRQHRARIHVAEQIIIYRLPQNSRSSPRPARILLVSWRCGEEGRDKNLPFKCACCPIEPRFTKRFRHTSNFFLASADCQNDYLNTMFTRDTTTSRACQKYDLSICSLDFSILVKLK